MLQSIKSPGVAQDTDSTALQQLRVGLLGEDGCTLQNSANLLLLLSVDALQCQALMDDVRAALRCGVSVVTIHDKDPSGGTEEFDTLVAACPPDLREGVIMHNGQRIQCDPLFDRLAVDWLGHAMPAYRKLSVALALRALKPGRKQSAVGAEEVAKRGAIKVDDLNRALEKATGGDGTKPQQHAVSVIQIGDI